MPDEEPKCTPYPDLARLYDYGEYLFDSLRRIRREHRDCLDWMSIRVNKEVADVLAAKFDKNPISGRSAGADGMLNKKWICIGVDDEICTFLYKHDDNFYITRLED